MGYTLMELGCDQESQDIAYNGATAVGHYQQSYAVSYKRARSRPINASRLLDITGGLPAKHEQFARYSLRSHNQILQLARYNLRCAHRP